MAAIAVVLALLEPEDTIVVPHDCYGGSWRLFNALAKKKHFKLITADLTDPRALASALADSPKIVWIETPSNPLLRITDLRFVAEAASVGALVVTDNRFPIACTTNADRAGRRSGGAFDNKIYQRP